MLIKPLDSVLGATFAEMYSHVLAYQPGWQWGHKSTDESESRFWFKHLTAEVDPLTKHLTKTMHELVKGQLGTEVTILRLHASGQTAGLITAPHYDDLESERYTFIYYPLTLSDSEGGETMFYNDDGSIRLVKKALADSAILFDSRIRHVGRPPTHAYRGLRITVTYKLQLLNPDAKVAG